MLRQLMPDRGQLLPHRFANDGRIIIQQPKQRTEFHGGGRHAIYLANRGRCYNPKKMPILLLFSHIRHALHIDASRAKMPVQF
jgi:hypothetical protein